MPDSAWNAKNKRVLRAETFVTRGWKSLAQVIGINLLSAAPAVLLAVSGKLLEHGKLFAVFVMLYLLCVTLAHPLWERAKLGFAVRRGNYQITRDLLCEKEHYTDHPGSRTQTEYYNLFFRRGDTGDMERQSVRKSRSDSLSIGCSYYRFSVNGKVLDIVSASGMGLDEQLEAHRLLSKEELRAKTAPTADPPAEPVPTPPPEARTAEAQAPSAPASAQTRRPRPAQAQPQESPVMSRAVQQQVDSLRMGPVPFRPPEGLSEQEKEERRDKMETLLAQYRRQQKLCFLLEPGMLAVSLLCALLFRGRHFEAAFVLWLILPVVYLFAVGAPLRRRARESLDAAMKVCPDQAGMDALLDKVGRSEKWAAALPLLLTTLHLILFFALGRIVLF